MRNAMQGLIALSALGFVLAVITALAGRNFLGVQPEGFSRASANLALLAIALALVFKNKTAGE
ncbi:MAG: hypothetical protein AB1486_28420 [Planctomycetota bacterium]